MNSRLLYIILLVAFQTGFSYGIDTTKVKLFSLKQAQDYAIQNSYKTLNANTNVEIAKKQVAQTTAIGLPQISGKADYQNYIDIPTMLMPNFLSPVIEGVLLQKGLITASQITPAGDDKFPVQFGTKHNVTGQLTASQLIFDGSYIVGLQAAKIFVDLSKKSLEKTEKETKEAVAQSYYLVLVALETKKILDSTFVIIKKNLEETKEFNKSGFIEATDVDQLQLLAYNIENKLNMLERQIEIANNLLKFQMGMDIKESIILTDDLQGIVKTAFAQNLTNTSFDFNNHIDYNLLKVQEKLTILNKKRDKYGYLPSLAAFITTSRNAQRSSFNFIKSTDPWFKTTIFGISLSLPIWDSGIKHFKIQQDKLELKKTKVLLKQVEQGLNLDVQNNIANVKTYTDQYFVEEKNIALAKNIYLKTLEKYKEGVSTSMDVSQAQNQYLTAQGNYFNVILQLLNANSNLNKALGN